MQVDITSTSEIPVVSLARTVDTLVRQARRDVKVRIIASEDLTSVEIERMYLVFAKYYNNHSREIFIRDLLEKDVVFLLRDSKTNVIQGFSTLLKLDLSKHGLKGTGFYSGDTVLEREYWGSRALASAFLNYVWREKIRNPFRPVYWFLISKGYKTYLLMTNNFTTHYPRLDRATPPKIQSIMDAFYRDRFGEQYKHDLGLIAFDDASCCLKEKVAAISHELIKNEKIRFFAEKNPYWERGWELPCLAEMNLWLPFKYLLKRKKRR